MNSSEISLRIMACYSTAAWRLILTETQLRTVAASIAVLIPPVVAINAALCVALFKMRQLQGCSKTLIFGLSVSDCFSGVAVMPSMVTVLLAYGHERVCWLERLFMILGQTNGHFSIYIMLSLAVQRLLKAKANPGQSSFFYGLFWSKSGLTKVFVACLLLSIAHGLVSVYFFGFVASKIPNIIMLVVRLLLTIFIYIIYFHLYFSIKRYVKRRVGFNADAAVHQKASYNAFFKTVALIMVVFGLCCLPLIVTDALTGYYTLFKKTAAPRVLRFLYLLSHSVFFMNSAINAGIFIQRDQAIRMYLNSLFHLTSPMTVVRLSRRLQGTLQKATNKQTTK